jgi:ADP-ribose pyrophosphatase
LHLYLAKGFERKENNLDEDEFLHVYEMDLEDAVSLIKKGKIMDAKTIIGIFLARNYLSKDI